MLMLLYAYVMRVHVIPITFWLERVTLNVWSVKARHYTNYSVALAEHTSRHVIFFFFIFFFFFVSTFTIHVKSRCSLRAGVLFYVGIRSRVTAVIHFLESDSVVARNVLIWQWCLFSFFVFLETTLLGQ